MDLIYFLVKVWGVDKCLKRPTNPQKHVLKGAANGCRNGSKKLKCFLELWSMKAADDVVVFKDEITKC